MVSAYRVTLAGPVPEAAAALIRLRFGDVSVHAAAGGGMVLEGEIVDQSAVRALLNLLWDVGSEVQLVQVTARAP